MPDSFAMKSFKNLKYACGLRSPLAISRIASACWRRISENISCPGIVNSDRVVSIKPRLRVDFYKEPNPNAYLATFAKFLIKHKDTEFCKKYIYSELEDFVENYIKQFDNFTEIPVHFVGSIAFYLKEELIEVLSKHNIKVGNVLRRPIDGLIAYHVMNK